MCWSIDKINNKLVIVETDLWVHETSLYFLYLFILEISHYKHFLNFLTIVQPMSVVSCYIFSMFI